MLRTICTLGLFTALLGLAATGFARTPSQGQVFTPKELTQKLQGTWQAISVEELGQMR